MRMELVIFVMLLSFSGISYAMDCATNAYSISCDKCNFSASGKMDQACYNIWQEYGKRCIAEKRPLLASAYSNGQCPAVDACAQELQTCKSSMGTGSDKQDCMNPLIGNCFTEADACVAKAERTCKSDIEALIDNLINWCPLPVFMILSLFMVGLFYSRSADGL